MFEGRWGVRGAVREVLRRFAGATSQRTFTRVPRRFAGTTSQPTFTQGTCTVETNWCGVLEAPWKKCAGKPRSVLEVGGEGWTVREDASLCGSNTDERTRMSINLERVAVQSCVNLVICTHTNRKHAG